ncbi:MAG: SulP family inorganic anion transporter [Myxococcales bacterium]|nr:SulP family inorganic anion transporter [Myxococcales bacterium]
MSTTPPLAGPAGLKATAPSDFLASIVVFLVALPLCMGVAIASGLPAEYGIITGIIGGLVVGFLQGSPMQVSGPAAGLTVVVWDLMQRHGHAKLAVAVALAGVLQVVAATAKGGRWFRAVPPSVIHGMLAGIGVLIFSSQVHVMVDDKPRGSGLENLLSIPAAVWKGVAPNQDLPHREAALVGLLTIVTLVLWNRFAKGKLKHLPGALVGAVVGALVANALAFPIKKVGVPDSLLETVLPPSSEALSWLSESWLWGGALMLAVIASAETLLCAGAVDRMHAGPRTQYNRELFAQGVGNLLCGLVGALPMTGVIVRSSANVQAGARTRLSTFLHGAWLLLLVGLLPAVLRPIPVSALAAILVYTGYKLVNPKMVKELAKYGKSEVVIFAATVTGIVALDLLKGVLLGLGLSMAYLLYKLSHLEIRLEDDAATKRAVLHLRGSATFLRLADIAEALDQVPTDRELHIRLDDLDSLDHATLELLSAWEKQHKARGADVIVDWGELDRRFRSGKQAGAEDARPPAAREERDGVPSKPQAA